MKFSIGYNYDPKISALWEAYRQNIEAVYFPMPKDYIGSGRGLVEPPTYKKQISDLIKKCRFLKITPQVLLNSTYEGDKGLTKSFWVPIANYIKRLRDAGLASVVVTNPLYIGRIKKEISGLRVESSVNCFVRTVEHALYLKDLGADVITIDRDINRNMPLIREIKKATGLPVRLMLNEGCLGNCPYRVMHYNFLSVGPKLTDKLQDKPRLPPPIPDAFCTEIYNRDPKKVFRVPFIPPEALRHYDKLVDYYKLSTRVFSTERTESCLKAYIKGAFSGNLLSILDCPGLSYFEYIDYDLMKKQSFFSKMLSCATQCKECGFCADLFKKAVLVSRIFQPQRRKTLEQKAIALYKKDLEKLNSRQNKANLYLLLGEAYSRLNRHKQAIENAKQALDLNSKVGGARYILGLGYEKERRFRRAIKALKEEAKIAPQNIYIKLALARCYRAIKKSALFEREINGVSKIAGSIRKQVGQDEV
jgi:tetratricopeptide (TPR) repeat protein